MGHRDLIADKPTEKIEQEVKKKLKEIIDNQKNSEKNFVLLTPLAEGADQLVAKVAIEINEAAQEKIKVIACYPWQRKNKKGYTNALNKALEKLGDKETYIKHEIINQIVKNELQNRPGNFIDGIINNFEEKSGYFKKIKANHRKKRKNKVLTKITEGEHNEAIKDIIKGNNDQKKHDSISLLFRHCYIESVFNTIDDFNKKIKDLWDALHKEFPEIKANYPEKNQEVTFEDVKKLSEKNEYWLKIQEHIYTVFNQFNDEQKEANTIGSSQVNGYDDFLNLCISYLFEKNGKAVFGFESTLKDECAIHKFLEKNVDKVTEIPLHNYTISKNDKDKYFDITSKFLVQNCDELLVLWDGVYTGNKGGTSVGYHDAVNGFSFSDDFTKSYALKRKKPKLRSIHHLSIPRKSNPYPVGRRYRDTENEPINLADYTKIYPYQWHTNRVKKPQKQFKDKRNYYSGKNNFFRRKYVWAYLLPFILIVLMFGFAILSAFFNDGIETIDQLLSHKKIALPVLFPKNWVYDLLYIIKVPSGDLDVGFTNFDWPKKAAIITGVFLIPYTLLVTVYYAVSNDIRIISLSRLFLFLKFRKNNYSLIMALGWKGTELAHNLKKKNRRNVAVIEKNPENANIKTALRNGIKVIEGNFNDPYILKKVNWHKAKDIYILGKDDETNIRAIELLDTLAEKTPKGKDKINIYAHIDDFRNKFFISAALRNSQKLNLTCFNIYENIVRKLLIKHPIDRFYYNDFQKHLPATEPLPNKKIKVIILGFNEVARALLRYCFTQLIFAGEKNDIPNIEIEIYPDIDDIQLPTRTNTDNIHDKVENKKEAIKNIIPVIFSNTEEQVKENGNKIVIQKYELKEDDEFAKSVYGNMQIRVYDLVASENDIIQKAKYLTKIEPTDIVSVFSCIDDGLRSSAYLAAILPALEVMKKDKTADIQTFCYFNFPEEKENSFIEERINNIASHVPVFFFGNFTQEFTEEAIKGQELDNLSRLINVFYYQSGNQSLIEEERDKKTELQKLLDTFGIKKTEVDEDYSWTALDEFKKESNRLAADHFFAKLRKLGLYLEKKNFNLPEENIFWDTIKTSLAFFKENKGLLYELCELEHRRWCAERLFYGWQPIPTENKPTFADWKKDKKTKWEPLKQHIDLQKFDEFTGDMNSEKDKDRIIIENMDLMFWCLGYEVKKNEC